MKAKKYLIFILAIVMLSAFDLPYGWFKAGSKPNSYKMGIEKGSGQDGKNAATIKSVEKKIEGFGTLMQQSKPDKYLGKRIKMTGFLRTEKVSGWAGLWLRIDQNGSKNPSSIDNMKDRKITGTTAWKKYEIVLDVPDNASTIAYGALIDGTGQIWCDDISFEIVDEGISLTGTLIGAELKMQSEPSNLDFEK
jgi:hypothetical protein